jgi:hypothetical protein
MPTVVWTVTALEAGCEFEWRIANPGLKTVAIHRLRAVGPERSRVTLTLDWHGPLAPLVRLRYGTLSRRYVATEAESLKRRCEAAVAADSARTA